jgi:hypothetical protein
MNKKTITKILDDEELLDLAKATEVLQELKNQEETDKKKNPMLSRQRSLEGLRKKKEIERQNEERRQRISKIWPK